MPKLPSGRQVTQLLSFSARGVSEEELVSKLQTFLVDLKPKHTRLLGTVASHSVVTRNIEIPSRDPNEIWEIVSLQATRHTPYARNEIVVDYLNLGVFKSVYTKILLIIVPRTVVMRFYEIALKLNVKVEKIFFAPEIIARNASKRVEVASEKLPVCVVQVDTSVSEFIVMSRDMLLFVRSIPVGAQHFAVAKEGYLIRFVEELRKSLEAYQSENIDQNPSVLFLSGATQNLEDLGQMVEEGLKLSVKYLFDIEQIPMHQELKDKYSSQNVSFLQVAAPALLFDELTVDLVPEENKLKKSVEERSREIVKTGFLTMAFLGVLCVFLLSYLYFRTARLSELRDRYDPIKKETQALEEAYGHVQAVKTHLANRGVAIERLAELSSLVSLDMYLTEVKFDIDGKFSVKGRSFKKPSIFSFVDKMESSDLFQNVRTKYITGQVEDGKEFADFEVSASLE
ncbi:MAG: PilN domain-containing protein [Candidatus Omnitrophica bacterium]|nr:PilN domain-containing protein [Candidatus Omnitrophota bacterium]